MENGRKHKLEIVNSQRELKRAKRHTKTAEAIAKARKKVVTDIHDDIHHFCLDWLECLKLMKGNWQSRASAMRLWFEFCLEVLPNSEEDLLVRLKNSRLFENGNLPPIKNPVSRD